MTETITTSYGTFQVDEIGYPRDLDIRQGPKCGCCTARHENVAAIRYCYDLAAEFRAQQAGEIAAEAAVERHFEDRGYWEARAQEDHEARTGVIDFQTAWDMACPERVTEREAAQAQWNAEADARLTRQRTPTRR